MDKTLEEKLFQKYPKIFKQKDLSCKETCMCWGIDCGDGWYPLIEQLCAQIQWRCDEGETKYIYYHRVIRFISKVFGNTKLYGRWEKKEISQVEAVQIKEKFGTLRFYYSGGNDQTDDVISFAENLSGTICEYCGATQDVIQTTGWVKTICKDCLEKESKK